MFMRYIPGTVATIALLTAVPILAEEPTATTRPPELVKLEAQAATEIPVPVVPPGRAAEVKKVAETSVALRRAQWVVEKLLPPPPEGMSSLRWSDLKVGSRGWIDTSLDVARVGDGFAMVRPPVGREGVMVAVPVAADAVEMKTMNLRGEFVIDRPVRIDGHDVLVLKEVTAAKPLDDAKAKVLDAARKRLELAKAAQAQSVAVLRDTRRRAEAKVMEKALAAAEKEMPVPKGADAEEQIKVKAKQQELALKSAKEELEKIAKMYADFPVIDPIEGSGVEQIDRPAPIKK
jgi:hypothetical protein